MNKVSISSILFVLALIVGGVFVRGCSTNNHRHETYQASCPFCRTIAHEEGTILHEDKDVVVIAKNRPVRPPLQVDCLIIPRKHIRSVQKLDLQDPYDQTILSKMDRVAQKLGKKLSRDGSYTSHINDEALQGVFHLHMHFKSLNPWKIDPSLWG